MEEQYLQKMFDLRVDAIILMGGKSDQLVTDLEYVDLLDRITDTTPIITTGKIEGSLCYQVCIDEMASVDLAMEHLFFAWPSAYCTDRREKSHPVNI